jgi:thioredoxin reductase/Pyruvate/2-oxoacid:ferredoxin oxidoreductase delta subunit
VLPVVDAHGHTNVPGIYALGELAGTPLVRLGLNAGHDLIEGLATELASETAPPEVLDLVIVGSGSSGLAATLAAKDRGLRTVTLEAANFANTFVTMTKGKVLFAEPEDIALRSRVWFEESTREVLLERWRALREREQLDIREHEKVLHIEGQKGRFEVVTAAGRYPCKRVALCMGKAGNPRTLGVDGESAHRDKIHHRLSDSAAHAREQIVIVGAGDVALEAAIGLAENGRNRVTLTAVDTGFTYPKKRNIDAVRALESAGHLRIELGSKVTSFDAGRAVIRLSDGQVEHVPFDHCFEMIGAELPIRFLRSVGIQLNTDWPHQRSLMVAASFLFIYSLYALKSYGRGLTAWPFESLVSPDRYDAVLGSLFSVFFAPFSWLFRPDVYQTMLDDRGFQQGYLYSGAYTIVLLGFGYQALIRWRSVATNPRYQTWRYASLVGFQVGFFLLVNVVGVQALTVKYSWRLWGLYQPFPLFFNTFFWWYEGDPTWIFVLFVGAGLAGTFLLIPLLSRNHGKRFCTWVCGCGGLAETLGDRWRHLAAKGPRSQAWEFQSLVVLGASLLVGTVLVGMYETHGDNAWWYAYNYIVDFWLVAVIPITLYPFYGGKVWCRYWCPLAAYNGVLAGWYGRLKIVSNDKCITCTQCSIYCQVGIDVMQFAKNGLPFDNSNSACIQCGICIDVCPMDVLSFETSDGLAKNVA